MKRTDPAGLVPHQLTSQQTGVLTVINSTHFYSSGQDKLGHELSSLMTDLVRTKACNVCSASTLDAGVFPKMTVNRQLGFEPNLFHLFMPLFLNFQILGNTML